MAIGPKFAGMGKVQHLFIKPAHKSPMESRREVVVSKYGLEGDVSNGSRSRQILLLEKETLAAFGVAPGALRENITTAGFTLAGLTPGSLIHIGPVTLAVTMDCGPCSQVEAVQPGLQAKIEGRRGTLARVVKEGRIVLGDEISVEKK